MFIKIYNCYVKVVDENEEEATAAKDAGQTLVDMFLSHGIKSTRKLVRLPDGDSEVDIVKQ